MAKRKKKKKLTGMKWLIALVLLALAAGSSKLREYVDVEALEELTGISLPETARPETEVPEGLEIPLMPSSKQGQVIRHTGYTLAYDSKTKTPQWVAWELTKAETQGTEKRAESFQEDPLVKGTKVTNTDYVGSGYDRGHMAPAGDMKWSRKAMEESFYMTNMCPQIHSLNAGDWNELEEKCRKWARLYGKVYIVCGPVYNGSRGTEYIGERRIKVPDAFYKVVLIYEERKTVALGFVFENEAGQRPLKDYLVSVDSIERLTGIDFFPALPDDIENRLEAEQHPNIP